MNEIVAVEVIQQKIFLIRGHNVMLDKDLAELYGVETKMLNRSVKRNLERFPDVAYSYRELKGLPCHLAII